jgi:predicted Zn-dependent peptidase
LNEAKLEEFLSFYKTFYVPNNCVLSIAGDINIDSTQQLIESYFGPIAKGTRLIPRPSVTEPPLNGEVRDVIEDNIQLPAVIQAYRAPKQGSDEYYAFNILSTLLSGGESARMQKKLVNEKQLALEAEAFPFFLEDEGLFITFALANVGNPPQVVETAMDSVVNELKATLVPEREFQKVKNQVETSFITGNSTMAGIAESLSDYEVFFGDANLINTEMDKYNKVTREDLQRVAAKYFNKNNRVVLYYVPKGTKQ